MNRVVGYIDGFNLFFGLRDSGLRRYYWLSPELLIQNLMKPWQTLAGVRYFSARISPSRAIRTSTCASRPTSKLWKPWPALRRSTVTTSASPSSAVSVVRSGSRPRRR